MTCAGIYIIKHRSSFKARHDKVQLIAIGRAIAHKCGGVALAAKSIGFMLQSKGFDEWKQVKDSDIWNESISSENTPETNNVLASLKLSYENMVKSLKSCLTYCAIFPKGHKIVRDDLIHHWLSLVSSRQQTYSPLGSAVRTILHSYLDCPSFSIQYHRRRVIYVRYYKVLLLIIMLRK